MDLSRTLLVPEYSDEKEKNRVKLENDRCEITEVIDKGDLDAFGSAKKGQSQHK